MFTTHSPKHNVKNSTGGLTLDATDRWYFNDNLWDASTERVRIWQRELHAETLLDLVPLVPGAADHYEATRKGRRIDGILLGQTLQHASPALDYHTHEMVVCRLQLSLPNEVPLPHHPTILHWKPTDFWHLTLHMKHWHDARVRSGVPEEAQAAEEEVARYIKTKVGSPGRDEVEDQLLVHTKVQPHNLKVKKKY